MNSATVTLGSQNDFSANQQRDSRLLRVFSEELRASFVTFEQRRDEILNTSLLESQDVPVCSFSDSPSGATSK